MEFTNLPTEVKQALNDKQKGRLFNSGGEVYYDKHIGEVVEIRGRKAEREFRWLEPVCRVNKDTYFWFKVAGREKPYNEGRNAKVDDHVVGELSGYSKVYRGKHRSHNRGPGLRNFFNRSPEKRKNTS